MRYRIFAFLTLLIVLIASFGFTFSYADDIFTVDGTCFQPAIPFSWMKVYLPDGNIYVGGQPFTSRNQVTDFSREVGSTSLNFNYRMLSKSIRALSYEHPVEAGDNFRFDFRADIFNIKGSDFIDFFQNFQFVSNQKLKLDSLLLEFTLDGVHYSLFNEVSDDELRVQFMNFGEATARYTSTSTVINSFTPVSAFTLLDNYTGVPNGYDLNTFISRGLIYSDLTGGVKYDGLNTVLTIRDLWFSCEFSATSVSSGLVFTMQCPVLDNPGIPRASVFDKNYRFEAYENEVDSMSALASWVDGFFSFSIGNIAFSSIVMFALTLSLVFFILKLRL